MLNQTVTDPMFFNQLVDFQTTLKQNFIHDHLGKLSGRSFNLDKRRIVDLNIPRKRKIPAKLSKPAGH